MRTNAKRARLLSRPLIMLVAVALTPFAGSSKGRGQQEKPQPSQPAQPSARPLGEPASQNILVASNSDYRIGTRDVIEVQIPKAPELSGTFAVSASGTFVMPYLGVITAQQKTPEELSKFIADSLRGRYLRVPHVSVVVKQYNSRSFFIQGAVRSPGVYKIETHASLLKLIILAGGLGENHGSTAFIIREIQPRAGAQEEASNGSSSPELQPKSPNAQSSTAAKEEGEEYELLKVNINGLLKGHFDQNFLIEPGDIVNIPPTDVFFVAGEVESPGSFPLKEGTTLRQAISLARGMTFEAAKNRGIIFREKPETGKREEIPVDIGEVMSGKKEDIAMMANDIVMVPNSRFKSVSGTLLRALGANVTTGRVRY